MSVLAIFLVVVVCSVALWVLAFAFALFATRGDWGESAGLASMLTGFAAAGLGAVFIVSYLGFLAVDQIVKSGL